MSGMVGHRGLLLSGASSDPLFANVALLLHCDGSNGSTTITDSSANARTPSAVAGGAQIETGQSVFGGASLALAGTGARVDYAATSGLALTGDFALEFRIRFTSVTGSSNYFLALDGDYDLYAYLDGTAKLSVYFLGVSRANIATLLVDTWYSLKISKSGTTGNVFLDGVDISSGSVTNVMTGNASMHIGGWPAGAGANTGGRCYIDELRLTRGDARGTSNYTPAGAAFPDG